MRKKELSEMYLNAVEEMNALNARNSELFKENQNNKNEIAELKQKINTLSEEKQEYIENENRLNEEIDRLNLKIEEISVSITDAEEFEDTSGICFDIDSFKELSDWGSDETENAEANIDETEESISCSDESMSFFQNESDDVQEEQPENLPEPDALLKAEKHRKAVDVKFSEEEKYAFAAIGKIVKTGVVYSNKLTENGDENSRDQVNLILGHTEVEKMKIYQIISSDKNFEEKKSDIDKCETDAKEYFLNVMAQY